MKQIVTQILVIAALAAVLGACAEERDAEIVQVQVPDIELAAVVSADVLHSLEGSHFPAVDSRNQSPRISRAKARELAVALAKQFGPYQRNSLEAVHGVPIDFGGLTADPRVLVAESPFHQMDGQHPLRAMTTDYYQVTLRQNGVRALRVAISTDLDVPITSEGVRIPSGFGHAWWPSPIPASAGEEYYPSPEAAALIAGAASKGARVAATPRLVIHPYGAPVTAFYELSLTAPVRVVGQSGEEYQADRLYVGPDGRTAAVPPALRGKGLSRAMQVGTAATGPWAFAQVERVEPVK